MMPHYNCRKQTFIAWFVGASLLGIALPVGSAEKKSTDEPDKISVDGPVLLPLNPPYGARVANPDTQADDEGSLSADDKEGPQLPSAGGNPSRTTKQRVGDPPKVPANKPAAVEKSDVPNSSAGAAEANSTEDEESAKLAEPNRLPAQPKRELTAPFIAMRDKVRKQLSFFRGQPLSMQDNTPTEILSACVPFGCQTEVLRGANRVNGITCLCWDYPCGGFELLKLAEGRMAARVGYGGQERPGQLLAVLAMSRVQTNYPMRVGEDVRTVADLVEYEKLSCRPDMDLSMKLIALAYYADPSKWKNDLGEDWSIERIIECEMAQPIVAANDGGTARLMGLSYAIERCIRRGQPLVGQYARAAKFTTDFQDYALGLQSSEGSWHPRFFTHRGPNKDTIGQLRSTGHILEWLVFSLPYERLEDPRVVRAVEWVNNMLSSQRYQNSLRNLNTREIDSAMHALRALAIYDERYFKPADPNADEPASESPAVDPKASAQRPAPVKTR